MIKAIQKNGKQLLEWFERHHSIITNGKISLLLVL